MEEKRERWRRLFDDRGVTQPPGALVDVRWKADGDDWYAQFEGGAWHWYDRRSREWRHVPYGPM